MNEVENPNQVAARASREIAETLKGYIGEPVTKAEIHRAIERVHDDKIKIIDSDFDGERMTQLTYSPLTIINFVKVDVVVGS